MLCGTCHALLYLPCWLRYTHSVLHHSCAWSTCVALVHSTFQCLLVTRRFTTFSSQPGAEFLNPATLLCSWCVSWSWTARQASCVHSLLLCLSGFKAPRALVWAMQPGQASGGRAWLQSPADSSLARAAALVRHAALQYLWLQHACLVWLCKPQDPWLSPCMVTWSLLGLGSCRASAALGTYVQLALHAR